MSRKTGASKDQIERALRSAAIRNYDPATVDLAISAGVVTSHSLLGTLDDYAALLVTEDECIVLRADLVALCETGDRFAASLYSSGREAQANALSATVDRLRAALGPAAQDTTSGNGRMSDDAETAAANAGETR